MSAIVQASRNAVIPVSRVSIGIRQATMADVPFMDSMQKKFGKQLGYFPTKQFEGYVSQNAILIAEENGSAIGYVISKDRYLKRDELGVVYQLCVAPGTQRKLVGASLIAEVFRRSAYGCKLYCCWCAQDIEANYFWESIGFVPIAFRAGSAKKSRVHIFWQRRVHAEDVTTPWWYPCATNGGAIREDRLVFPIPPGVHWKDVTAVAPRGNDEGRMLDDDTGRKAPRRIQDKTQDTKHETRPTRQQITTGGLFFAAVKSAKAKAEKTPRPPRVKTKNDPAMAAKARELRDRWMEQLNRNPQMLLGDGKYDVARLIDAPRSADRLGTDQVVCPTKMLAA